MPDSSTPRRCGIRHRPLRPHEKELCGSCEGELMYDDKSNPSWDEDMQTDVDSMKAALEGTEPDDARRFHPRTRTDRPSDARR